MRSRIQGARALVRLITASPSTVARRGVASSSAILTQPRQVTSTSKPPSDASSSTSTTTLLPTSNSSTMSEELKAAVQSSTTQSPSPPPSSLSNVAEQAFMADYRPLLSHNVTHSRPKHAHSRPSSRQAADLNSEAALEHLIHLDKLAQEQHQTDTDVEMQDELEAMDESRSLACSILQSPQSALRPKWNKALANVSQASFERALDTLAANHTCTTTPTGEVRSTAVVHEAHRLALEQRIAAHKTFLLSKARSRGEETDVIEALGFEANVVVLGEPKGPAKEWGTGVATLLSEHTRPLQPPPVPQAVPLDTLSGAFKPDAELEALSNKFTQTFIEHARPARALELDNLDTAEPNLFLSHALVQTQLPRLLAWDRIEAQMDGAVWRATHDATATDGAEALEYMRRKGVNLKTLNAKPLANDVAMDSVKRKRKKKMRKQKYRKLRKATRIERRRQKRD